MTVWVGKWAEILAPFFVGAALMVKLGHYLELHHPATHWLLGNGVPQIVLFRLLPVALPLIAGIAHSLRSALDSGRRFHSYLPLIAQLERVKKGFGALRTEAAIRRTVVSTEEILLDELVQWHLAERQNSTH